MKSLIIAGGKGTRMKDVSKEIPKALLPVNGKPVCVHQIDFLREHGIKDIVFCIGHLGDQIVEFIGDGSLFGVNVSYAEEKEPLGTGGAIRNGYEFVKDEEDFVVLFGDIMIDMDLSEFIEFHKQNKAVITFAVHKSDHPEDSSNVKLDNGRIVSIGRPKHGHPITGITRTSIQIMNKRCFDYIPERKISLEDEVIPNMLESGERVFGYYTDEFIKDMGTPERYKKVGGDI